MAGRRRLPLVTEQSLATLRFVRTQLASDFDRELQDAAADGKLRLSCRVGCANCCYHPVMITAIEGALLYRHIAERGRWTPSFQQRVREHATKTRDLPMAVWFLSAIPCPLLDDKTKKCTAYEGRPFACRATYAFGDPDDCHPHRIEKAGLVNRKEVTSQYHTEQTKIASKHGLQMVVMPLSAALLLGEKIINGEVDLEDSDVSILRDYMEIR